MSSSRRKYVVAQAVWFVAVAVTVVAVYTGNAEPLVSPGQLPGGGSSAGGLFIVGAAAVLIVAGVLVIGRFESSAWTEAGQEAGLTPEGGGVLGSADLTGTVRGRPVCARTVSRKAGGDSRSGSNVTYTVVETDLTEPAEDGIMISRTAEGESAGRAAFGDVSVDSTAVDDRFAVVGGEGEDLARQLLSGRTRNLLLDVEDLETLTIGDTTGVLLAGMPDMSGSLVGGVVEDKLEGKLASQTSATPSTVAIESEGVLLDAEELQRRIDAVVTTAEAYEDATESPS